MNHKKRELKQEDDENIHRKTKKQRLNRRDHQVIQDESKNNGINLSQWLTTSVFKENQDKDQYKKIFKAVYQSGLIIKYKVGADSIRNISEFAVGLILKCHNDEKCDEDNIFIYHEVLHLTPIKCVGCNQINFGHFCDVHGDVVAVSEAVDPLCDNCWSTVCHDAINYCFVCDRCVCNNCFHFHHETCSECVRYGGDDLENRYYFNKRK